MAGRVRSAATIALCLVLGSQSYGAERSREVAAQFRREHPCPSTGKARGACPGHVRDHIIRSATADRIRSPTCNGKRSRTRRLKTDGSALSARRNERLPAAMRERRSK